MAVKLTRYAERRLVRRKITLEQVLDVLDRPEQISFEQGRQVAQSRYRRSSGREHLLRVVFETQGEDTIVVTFYTTAKLKKYWRES